MTCSTSVTFKRGTTFAGTVTYTPETGGPANLLTTTVTSSIIDAAGNTYPTTITMAVDGLSFVSSYSSTANWTLGSARWDIKFAYGTTVFYSETMRLNIIDQVTD
jgi:hypothetical protein